MKLQHFSSPVTDHQKEKQVTVIIDIEKVHCMKTNHSCGRRDIKWCQE